MIAVWTLFLSKFLDWEIFLKIFSTARLNSGESCLREIICVPKNFSKKIFSRSETDSGPYLSNSIAFHVQTLRNSRAIAWNSSGVFGNVVVLFWDINKYLFLYRILFLHSGLNKHFKEIIYRSRKLHLGIHNIIRNLHTNILCNNFTIRIHWIIKIIKGFLNFCS